MGNMSYANFDAMGKNELRAACKAVGISYGKLDNAGMRAALKAAQAILLDDGQTVVPMKPARATEQETESDKL